VVDRRARSRNPPGAEQGLEPEHHPGRILHQVLTRPVELLEASAVSAPVIYRTQAAAAEHGIHKTGCVGLKAWGRQWMNLGTFAIGSPPYNAALQAITEQFVAANTNPAQLPNRSSLNQLRTNEILNPPWQLREFHLAGEDVDTGHLRQVVVKQTLRTELNTQQVVADYIAHDQASIAAGTNVVPAEFPVPPGDRSSGRTPTLLLSGWLLGRAPAPSQRELGFVGPRKILVQHLQRLSHERDAYSLHAHQAGSEPRGTGVAVGVPHGPARRAGSCRGKGSGGPDEP